MYRAVVAENEPVLRMTFSHFLEESGAEVYTAKNGREAYRKCMTCTPDIVISSLDLTLDGDPGDSLIAALRREFPELPILAVSGSDREHNNDLAHRLGANAFVRKPVDGKSLVKRVDSILRAASHIWNHDVHDSTMNRPLASTGVSTEHSV